MVPLTSQLTNATFTLANWKTSGLNVLSAVKAQLATVKSSLVLKVIGRLTRHDRATLDGHLRQWLEL